MPETTPIVSEAAASEQARARFRQEIERWQMGPLWEIYRAVLTREPRLREVPWLWRWSVVRPRLLRAGELITALEAERRVLMYLNPGAAPVNGARIGATATLYAAAQLILPGETARAHRHSPAALRFLIEGRGAFTCVEGEKIWMEPGDLILTPAGLWHDHGNEGAEPVMWLDGLDIPLTAFLNSMFLEDGAALHQDVALPEAHSERLYGRAMFPATSAPAATGAASPVLAYRWDAARAALDSFARCQEPDAFDGHLLRYANPATGGEALPTMGCRLQLLPKGLHTRAHRHTISTVYHVAEGRGYSVLNGVRFDWEKGDTFAVPTWCWHEHAVENDVVLFSVTDEPILKPFGLIRSQPLTDGGGFQPVQSVFNESAPSV